MSAFTAESLERNIENELKESAGTPNQREQRELLKSGSWVSAARCPKST